MPVYARSPYFFNVTNPGQVIGSFNAGASRGPFTALDAGNYVVVGCYNTDGDGYSGGWNSLIAFTDPADNISLSGTSMPAVNYVFNNEEYKVWLTTGNAPYGNVTGFSQPTLAGARNAGQLGAPNIYLDNRINTYLDNWLKLIDDIGLSKTPQQTTEISTINVYLKYPKADQPLQLNIDNLVTDVGARLTFGAITWVPSAQTAVFNVNYTASFRVNSKAEYPIPEDVNIVVNDTTGTGTEGDSGTSVLRVVYDPLDEISGDIIIYFSRTGNADPYGNIPDEESDDIDDTQDPAISAVTTGFMQLYSPTEAQIKQLASYMWTDSFIDTIKKLFNDPMETIIGLSILPVTPYVTGQFPVVLGNVNTGIYMSRVGKQFATVNCGSITCDELYHSYLDYNPYTKIWVFLPYIGIVPLDTDSVMNKSLNITYHVDLLSGSCVAHLIADGSVIGVYNGACGVQIPVTNQQYGGLLSGLVQTAAGTAAMIAGVSTGNFAAGIAGGVNAALGATQTAKNTVTKSGQIGSASGLMSIQTPFLLIERPRQAQPLNQNKYLGYPAFVTVTLGNISGYTEVANIILNNITASQKEIEELEGILKSGVIF